MDKTETNQNQETAPDVEVDSPIILHDDGPTIVTPQLGGAEINGRYKGNTDDNAFHVFEHANGSTFHVPFFGQMDSALQKAKEKTIDPIGKLFRIVVLDIGRYLIKIIEG